MRNKPYAGKGKSKNGKIPGIRNRRDIFSIVNFILENKS